MKPTQLERRMLRYHGASDQAIADAERLSLDVVRRARARLRARGVEVFAPPDLDGQMTLPDVDRAMRENRGVPGA